MEHNEAKPAPWSAERTAAFQGKSVVDRYQFRPPYPQAVIDALAELVVDTPRAVLDVGTGTGELARRLVGSVDRVDAVDLSPAMIARGRTLPRATTLNCAGSWGPSRRCRSTRPTR